MSILDMFSQKKKKPNNIILRESQNIPDLIQLDDFFDQMHDYSNITNQAKAYNSFVWVYGCVNKIAESGAMTPFSVLKRIKEGLEDIENHPFEELLLNPNPFMSRFELWERTFASIELLGNAYWFIDFDEENIPASIWVMRADRIKPIPNKSKWIDGYEYQAGSSGKKREIPTENIVHFKRFHPLKEFVGASAIEAAAQTLEMERAANIYNAAFFKNNAKPTGVLTTDQSLSREQIKIIIDQWNMKFKGGDKSHKTALLTGGVKFQAIGMPPKDIEFIELKNKNMDEICAIFGVPPAKLGLSKDVNRANAEALDYTFNQHTMKPKMWRIAEKITQQILPYYQKGDEKLVGQFDEQVESSKTLMLQEIGAVGAFLTVNEIRKRYLHMPPVSWGDALSPAIVPSQPAGSVDPNAPQDPNAPVDQNAVQDPNAPQEGTDINAAPSKAANLDYGGGLYFPELAEAMNDE